MRDDDITLKSGKVISPNCGFISIVFDRHHKEWLLANGYDSQDSWLKDGWDKTEEGKFKLVFTEEEITEIADMMINRWIAFSQDIPNLYKRLKAQIDNLNS